MEEEKKKKDAGTSLTQIPTTVDLRSVACRGNASTHGDGYHPIPIPLPESVTRECEGLNGEDPSPRYTGYTVRSDGDQC